MIATASRVNKLYWLPNSLVAATLLLLSLLTSSVRAEMTLSARTVNVAGGATLELQLLITNADAAPLTVNIPAPLHVSADTGTATTVLEFQPDRSGPVEIAPRGFMSIRLQTQAPRDLEGALLLTPTGLETNSLLVQVHPASEKQLAQATTEAAAGGETSLLVDKPPPLALSVYEPVYFLVGGDGGLNAKFQIGFRYRLFDGEGRLARRLPWLDDVYLSYSQTSLWDLNELSKPFKDSSYRPRLFFADYDLWRGLDGQLRLGFEAGAGHESNGKEGEDSRSYNMFYVRPTLTFGDPDGFRAYVAPLVHNYVADDENPDMKHYRGYVDWLFGVGSKGGLDFWGTLRNGSRSSFGSIELNVSYPLSKLSGGDLSGWLMLQYFNGYGESLVDYNRKLDSQLRLGIAVAL